MLVSARTGAVLGRPWLTVLVDAFSRSVLAFRLSFDAPSRESVFAALYDCVFRHRRLPEMVVVDQGADFMSDDLDIALAYLGVSKMERPAEHARYGAVIDTPCRMTLKVARFGQKMWHPPSRYQWLTKGHDLLPDRNGGAFLLRGQ